MNVDLPHSLDFHSAEVDPGSRYADLAPGKSMHYRFTAGHPGVFMYHCATKPVLMHTGAGMVGMFVVKPKGLAPVDKELWITQQEFYIGKPGADADMAKMAAKKPDVIAFNGYANQYGDAPIPVRKGERVRAYVLNAGPSIWSAFHVIGTVFDRTVVEGTVGHDAQTISLAPSQGGWVEFTLAEEGNYPFVTHAFGDMVRGAMGVLATTHAPKAAGGHWPRLSARASRASGGRARRSRGRRCGTGAQGRAGSCASTPCISRSGRGIVMPCSGGGSSPGCDDAVLGQPAREVLAGDLARRPPERCAPRRRRGRPAGACARRR